MPIQGFNHINLHLPRAQLESVRDFYVDLLGFVDGDRPPFRRSGYWLYCGDLALRNRYVVAIIGEMPDAPDFRQPGFSSAESQA